MKKSLVAKLGISLLFWLLPGMMLEIPSLLFMGILYFIALIITLEPLKKITGSYVKTIFIQLGGVFIMAGPIFVSLMYGFYKLIKDSFVIPNFSEAHICAAREFYFRFKEMMGYGFICSLIYAPVCFFAEIIIMLIKNHINKKFKTEE